MTRRMGAVAVRGREQARQLARLGNPPAKFPVDSANAQGARP